MTFEQFAAIYTNKHPDSPAGRATRRHGPLVLTVEQAWDQVCDFVQYHWPSDVIFDDANLQKIVDSCLWNGPLFTSSELAKAARETRENLRHHVPPQPAPELPSPPAPVAKTRDSLGDGAASTESGIPHHSNTPKESTALQDAADYCYSEKDGGSNYRNKLERIRQECRNASYETIDGRSILNHSKANQLFQQRKAALDQSMLPSPKNNDDYLQQVAAKAIEEAIHDGFNGTEVLRRADIAVREAQAKLKS